MAIEERAIKIANEYTGSFGYALRDDFVDACEKIAIEQQEIDIRRAVEWLKGVFLEQYLTTMCSVGYENNVFNDKFFSDFKQAMKGE